MRGRSGHRITDRVGWGVDVRAPRLIYRYHLTVQRLLRKPLTESSEQAVCLGPCPFVISGQSQFELRYLMSAIEPPNTLPGSGMITIGDHKWMLCST